MSVADPTRTRRLRQAARELTQPGRFRVPVPDPLRRFFTDYRYPLGVFLASRVLCFLVVGMAGWVSRPKHGRWTWSDVFLKPLGEWDGVWYTRIAQHGYDPAIAHGDSPAFFPLYPLLVRAVHTVTPFGYVMSAVVLSTACFGVALSLLWRLTIERFGVAIARRTVTYTAIFPFSFIFSAAYTESLFLLVVVLSFLLLERSRFASFGAVAALAVLTRPVGILLLLPLAWRIWTQRHELHGRRRVLAAVGLALPVLALAGFQLYLWYRTGALNATQEAQARGWGRGSTPLLVLLMPIAFLNSIRTAFGGNHDLSYALCALFASIWFWTGVAAVRRKIPIEYVLFAGAAIIAPIFAGTYIAVPRYGMVLFPLIWVWAQWGGDERVDHALRSFLPAFMAAIVFVTYVALTLTP